MKKGPIGFYDYTVILTYCGMLSALVGIMFALQGHYILSMFMLILSGLCDMFDGTVASRKERTEQQKMFGIQIDSLSDMVSFGVFPAVFGFVLCNQSVFAGIVSALYVLCALIRLAYFNVLEEERQSKKENGIKTFIGVPVTTIAIILPAAYFFYNSRFWNSDILITVVLALTAAGFVFPVSIRKPRKTGKLIILLIGAVVFAALLALFIIRKK